MVECSQPLIPPVPADGEREAAGDTWIRKSLAIGARIWQLSCATFSTTEFFVSLEWLGAVFCALLFFLGSIQSRVLDEQRLLFTAAWTMMGLPLGAGIMASQKRRWFADGPDRHRVVLELTAVGIFCAGAGWLSYWCGMRQFAALDWAYPIESGWRILSGQHPYVDFACTMPPGFWIGSAAAFWLFGVTWRADVLINLLYLAVTFAWLYALLRTCIGNRLLSFMTAVFCEALSTILISFWWYNSTTTMAGALFAISCVALLGAPQSKWRWISFASSLALLALMKPNVAGVLILGCSASLFCSKATRKAAVLGCATAFALCTAIILATGSTPLQVLGGYLAVAHRGSLISYLAYDMSCGQPAVSLTVLGLVVAMAAAAASANRRHLLGGLGPIHGVALSCILAGLYGFLTNDDLKLVDIPLTVIGTMILAAKPDGKRAGRLEYASEWKQAITLLLMSLTLTGGAQAVMRQRVHLTGYGTFFENEVMSDPSPGDFFQGGLAGQNLWTSAQEIGSLCGSENPGSIFFGPWLEWAYAAFKVPPPKGLPLLWDPGVSFPTEDEGRYEQKWFDAKFDHVVFLAPPSQVPAEFLAKIDENYVADPRFPPRIIPLVNVFDRYQLVLEVLKRKDAKAR